VQGKSSDSYNINVCGGIPSIPACSDAALCMEFVYFKGDYYELARSHTAPEPLFASSDSGVTLTYHNGNMDQTQVQTIFTFTCTVRQKKESTHTHCMHARRKTRGDRRSSGCCRCCRCCRCGVFVCSLCALLCCALQSDASTRYTVARVSQSTWSVGVQSPLACPIAPPQPTPTPSPSPSTECGFNGLNFRSHTTRKNKEQVAREMGECAAGRAAVSPCSALSLSLCDALRRSALLSALLCSALCSALLCSALSLAFPLLQLSCGHGPLWF
jgi:hypothetical protein